MRLDARVSSSVMNARGLGYLLLVWSASACRDRSAPAPGPPATGSSAVAVAAAAVAADAGIADAAIAAAAAADAAAARTIAFDSIADEGIYGSRASFWMCTASCCETR